MKKIYYQLKLKQKSPLRIGNGDSKGTDSDLMVDMRGYPFIPGSSLAGVLRTYLEPDDANRLFGEMKDEETVESRVSVSDAVLGTDAVRNMVIVYRRDGVGLNDWGTAIPGHKYDFQVVETDELYTAVLEYDPKDGEEDALDCVMQRIVSDGMCLGARTMRGYGSFEVSVKKKEFIFPGDVDKWILFDPFEADAFEDGTIVDGSAQSADSLQIQISFQINGSLNIRERRTSYEELEDGTTPDSVPLMNAEAKPVIPGTAWAGVFRHHMRDLVRDLNTRGSEGMEKELKEVDALFGVMENEDHKRSGIRFSESVIEGGGPVSGTRNAVERFTQGPKNTGLFTVRYWQGGIGELTIEVRKEFLQSYHNQLLALSINDLHLGLVSVGGEAGVGRGRIEIRRLMVNGTDRTENMRRLETDYLEVV